MNMFCIAESLSCWESILLGEHFIRLGGAVSIWENIWWWNFDGSHFGGKMSGVGNMVVFILCAEEIVCRLAKQWVVDDVTNQSLGKIAGSGWTFSVLVSDWLAAANQKPCSKFAVKLRFITTYLASSWWYDSSKYPTFPRTVDSLCNLKSGASDFYRDRPVFMMGILLLKYFHFGNLHRSCAWYIQLKSWYKYSRVHADLSMMWADVWQCCHILIKVNFSNIAGIYFKPIDFVSQVEPILTALFKLWTAGCFNFQFCIQRC